MHSALMSAKVILATTSGQTLRGVAADLPVKAGMLPINYHTEVGQFEALGSGS